MPVAVTLYPLVTPVDVAKTTRCISKAGFLLMVVDETVSTLPPFTPNVNEPSASDVTDVLARSESPRVPVFVMS